MAGSREQTFWDTVWEAAYQDAKRTAQSYLEEMAHATSAPGLEGSR